MDVIVSLLAIFCLLLGGYCFRYIRSPVTHKIDLPYAISTAISVALTALLIAMLIFGYNSQIVVFAFFLVATVSIVVMCSYIIYFDSRPNSSAKKVALFVMVVFLLLLLFMLYQWATAD